MRRNGLAAAVAAMMLTAGASTAAADDSELDDYANLEHPESTVGSYAGLQPPETAAPHQVSLRLAVAERLIERQHDYAEIWWKGWVSFYSIGLVVQGTRASLTDDTAERADLIISAVKAAGGILRYSLDPYAGIEGLESVEPLPQGTVAERRARLAQAEKILRANAVTTDENHVWYAHLINIGINAAGGLIVAFGFDDPKTGFISAGIGVAVGEVALFTQPFQADDDWEDYRHYFAGGFEPGEKQARLPPRGPSFTFSPGPLGGSLEVVF